MRYLALLRGVMPTGKNRIPKISDLVIYLSEAGLQRVSTYIQSGNIICETDLAPQALAALIHQTILEKIGADLSVIVKTAADLRLALDENPFAQGYDKSRIHLVFSNEKADSAKVAELEKMDFGDEKYITGSTCLYMYLPREAKKKKLNNNFLEKKLSRVSTMRKLGVIEELDKRMIN
ncbi:DUF1697 domain-containing protein [Streptococcus massiliensis]|uniref:Uncharacterized protein conserved in bacteria n=1 Tax=Streptococcus massiliensis TaxID=313439 RepID=A0A380L0G5_9STRE|nr:DUF1697 domain-containing protein [Streptococcus massiliensis]SUN77519.1 Uncharacterized protein conserved in bacteria [Streptococcus massiliensis]